MEGRELFMKRALDALLPVKPRKYRLGDTWEDMYFFGSDIQKPPKEVFEAKLQELIDAQPWKELREERNKRIARTDYLAIPDYPHATEGVKQAWLDYRQALRDLPGNTTDPENPVWPTPPGA